MQAPLVPLVRHPPDLRVPQLHRAGWKGGLGAEATASKAAPQTVSLAQVIQLVRDGVFLQDHLALKPVPGL